VLPGKLKAVQKKAVVFGSPPWGGLFTVTGPTEKRHLC
jgi:hypothetical protein